MVFIPLIYNSGDQNALINDWCACLQVLSKLTVWNAYLSLLGYNLVIYHFGTSYQGEGVLDISHITHLSLRYKKYCIFISHT